MSDTLVIMCAPVDWDAGIPGSVKAQGACGHELWIAPSGLSMVLNPTIETKVICLRCFSRAPGQDLYEVPGQRDELGKTIGEQETNDLMKRLGVKKLGE